MLGQGAAAGLVGLVNDIAGLAVDLGSGGLAVTLALTKVAAKEGLLLRCLLYTSPSPRDS